MVERICINCGRTFEGSPRHRTQSYCNLPECQRARKADWQRTKMATDPEYRAQQRISQANWRTKNPDYWKEYRKRKPAYEKRNRLFQRNRNRKRRNNSGAKMDASVVIAKMDPSDSMGFSIVGQYWLVPVIAKMDPLKVNIVAIADG